MLHHRGILIIRHRQLAELIYAQLRAYFHPTPPFSHHQMVTRWMLPSYFDYWPSSSCTSISYTYPPRMQGFLSYMPLPTSATWRRLISATADPSPATGSSHGVHHPSSSVVSLPSNYPNYDKNIATSDNTHLTGPGRILTQKDAARAIATIRGAHRSNFSLASFIGGAPMDTTQRDPSPRSSSGVSVQSGGEINQGPNQDHPESEMPMNLEDLESANKAARLRKLSSSMSLKLKLPRLMGLKQQKNKDPDGQSFSSSTFNSPLSLDETSRWGTLAFQKDGPTDSASPGPKGDIPSAANKLSYSATSMTSKNEGESGSPTLSTTTDSSSLLTPRQNLKDKFVSLRDYAALPASPGSDNTRSRNGRAYPTKTRDDMSIDVYPAVDGHKSWSRRLTRRASLSAGIMSFSESQSQTSSLALSLDHNANKNPDDAEFLTQTDPGYSASKPIGPTLVTSPLLNYLTEDSATPTAPIYPDMTSPPASDNTPLQKSQPPVRESFSTSASRTPSTDSRVSTSETTSASSYYTSSSTSLHPKKRKPTPAQLAQWREDEEILLSDLDDEFEGDVCLIRFEPKHGWFGFWNKESVNDVIDDLRDLRSPKS